MLWRSVVIELLECWRYRHFVCSEHQEPLIH